MHLKCIKMYTMHIYFVIQMQWFLSFNIDYNEVKALCLKSEVICIDQNPFLINEVSFNVRFKGMLFTGIVGSRYNWKTKLAGRDAKQQMNKYKTPWTLRKTTYMYTYQYLLGVTGYFSPR